MSVHSFYRRCCHMTGERVMKRYVLAFLLQLSSTSSAAQQKFFSRVTQQQDDFSRVTQQQDDFSRVNQQQDDFSRVTQQQDDFSRVTQQQDDFSRVNQQQDDFSRVTQQQDDFSRVTQQQDDFSRVTQWLIVLMLILLALTFTDIESRKVLGSAGGNREERVQQTTASLCWYQGAIKNGIISLLFCWCL